MPAKITVEPDSPIRPSDDSDRRLDPARWNEQNREAIAAYNRRIDLEGLPLARYRTFAIQRDATPF